MKSALRWHDHVRINVYWLGLNISAGIITPVLLPYLVALFVSGDQKNTSLATVRVLGLIVAMLVQPIAGMLSDRNSSRWGKRRPFIFWGTILDLVFLGIIAASPGYIGSALDGRLLPMLGVSTAYVVLIIGMVLLQASSNFAQGALQGLLPDLVPSDQRGRSSGVKAVLEVVVPALLVIGIGIGPLVDAGRIGFVTAFIGASLLLTMLITVLFVHEKPLEHRPAESVREPMLRIVALTAIFVLITQGALWLVHSGSAYLATRQISLGLQVALVGLLGMIAMTGSIFAGVYAGARVGIGRDAPKHRSFIWWVINRLLFLAAIGSIQGFALFYLSDVLEIKNAATTTTLLMAVVALFLMTSALVGGYLADRIGRKRLVRTACWIAAAGAFMLLFANSIPLVMISGVILGIGTGAFMATNWALGTDLVPADQRGRYLGISNLAGAGAGIVGAGIGGPIADFFNRLQPGLGYLVIFAIYAGLFLVAALTLRFIPEPGQRT
ncbi:MAG: MFS transporter [Anaerolineales bacterium]|nr:MAG: MFS transporter [Anaerolineales bacterium]